MTAVRPPSLARRLTLSLALVALGLLMNAPARAAANADARLALHLAAVSTKNACTRAEAAPACAALVTAGDLFPATYYAYLLVTKGDAAAGIAGLQCGLNYNGMTQQGVDVFSWTSCASLDFPSTGWPGPGGGNLVTWDSLTRCQRGQPDGPGGGVTATAGYFYLAAYSADQLTLTPRPVDGLAKVADCDAHETIVEGGPTHHAPGYLGVASFSAGAVSPGHNACAAPASVLDATITGPDVVPRGGGGLVYAAEAAPAGATFQWSVAGDAVIPGPVNGRSVEVQASTGSYFTLTVRVSAGASFNSGTKLVQLLASDCPVSGPTTVATGAAGLVYTSSGLGPAGLSHTWSVTGNGMLTSAPGDPTAVVTAGAAGTFAVRIRIEYPGGTYASCGLTVLVLPTDCLIAGPDSVRENTPLATWSASPAVAGSTYEWSFTGNAERLSPPNWSQLILNCGPPGPLHLDLRITRGQESISCSRDVTVTPATDCPTGPAGNPGMALHLLPRQAEQICFRGTRVTCRDIVTRGALYPAIYYALVLGTDAPAAAGVAQLEFGVDYDGAPSQGLDIFSWSICASFEVQAPGWPAPGTGTRIIWDPATRCQRGEPGGAGTGVMAMAGYFYLAAYTPDQLRLTPGQAGGTAARLYDCNGCVTALAASPAGHARLGTARFSAYGNEEGYNPCGAAVLVRPTTWSAIKAMYGK